MLNGPKIYFRRSDLTRDTKTDSMLIAVPLFEGTHLVEVRTLKTHTQTAQKCEFEPPHIVQQYLFTLWYLI